MSARHPRCDEGSALVLALIAAFLLILVSVEVALTTRIETFIGKNIELDTKLEVSCRAGLEKALAVLREDRQQTEIDSTNDAWNEIIVDNDLIESDVASEEFLLDDEDGGFEEPQDITLYIQIFDEAAKFNVYQLAVEDAAEARLRKDRFANVIDYFRRDLQRDLSFGEGTELADELYTFLRRTKDRPYGDSPKPPTKGTGTLTDVSELLYCHGITPQILWDTTQDEGEKLVPGLYRFVTIWSDLQTNINTGELPAIAGLFDRNDAQLAERVIEYRTEHREESERTGNRVSETGTFNDNAAEEQDPTGDAPFAQINEIKEKVEGMTDEVYNQISSFITVQSNVFSIYVTAKRGFIRRTKMFVVRRSDRGFQVLFEKLVDFRYLIPNERLNDAEDTAAENSGRYR